MRLSTISLKIAFINIICFASFIVNVSAQNNFFIYSSEGREIMSSKQLISSCLQSFHTNKNDSVAMAICECQVGELDRRFSNKQYKKYNHGGLIDIQGLLSEDSIAKKQIQDCFTNSGKTMLLQAQNAGNDFIDSCIQNIKRNTKRRLDNNNLHNFCSCQLNLIKEKKLSDEQLSALENPNSLLFYEVMYKCGDPYAEQGEINNSWTKDAKEDITGPDTDSIKILTLNGMTYIQMKTGTLVQFCLFDTGSSDLLINDDIENVLLKEGLIKQENYLGTGEYEMANGAVDTCRKYMVSNIQIGRFAVNNVVVAVTDKGKKIILGRSLLNKFNNWKLDNEKDLLILNK